MLFISQHVLDDYLQHVLSRHEVSAKFKCAPGNQSFLVSHVAESQRIFLAGKHRLPVPEQSHLRDQLLLVRGFIEVCVVNDKEVVHQHAPAEVAYRRASFGISLVDRFLIPPISVRTGRGLIASR